MPKNAGTEPLYDHLHIMWHCALIRLLQFNSFAATAPSFIRLSLLSLLGQHCCYAQRTSSCVSLDSATPRMQRRNTKQFEPVACNVKTNNTAFALKLARRNRAPNAMKFASTRPQLHSGNQHTCIFFQHIVHTTRANCAAQKFMGSPKQKLLVDQKGKAKGPWKPATRQGKKTKIGNIHYWDHEMKTQTSFQLSSSEMKAPLIISSGQRDL